MSETAYAVMWEFQVKPGSEARFEAAYGNDGEWVQLFRRDARYIRTELVHDLEASHRYITIDYWTSQTAYEEFRQQHAEEYKRIDARCEMLTESEKLIGKFVTVDSAPARH